MNYRDNPPPTFRCGHARSPENTIGIYPERCRACYRFWENNHRKKPEVKAKRLLEKLAKLQQHE